MEEVADEIRVGAYHRHIHLAWWWPGADANYLDLDHLDTFGYPLVATYNADDGWPYCGPASIMVSGDLARESGLGGVCAFAGIADDEAAATHTVWTHRKPQDILGPLRPGWADSEALHHPLGPVNFHNGTSRSSPELSVILAS